MLGHIKEKIKEFGNQPSRVMVLPPRSSRLKISPAFIKGATSDPASGVRVMFVKPERGQRVAKTTTPDGVTFKLR